MGGGGADTGKARHVWRQEVDGKSLHLPIKFAVNLKLLLNESSLFQTIITAQALPTHPLVEQP